MTRDLALQTGVLRKELRFEDDATFAREYQTNISHGGTFVPWPDPPPIDTPVQLVLHPPRQLPPVELEAVVVYTSPQGVGLQLSGLEHALRKVIEEYVRVCQAGEPAGQHTELEVAPLAGEGMNIGLEAARSLPGKQDPAREPFAEKAAEKARAIRQLETLLADGSSTPTVVLKLENVDKFLAEYEANLRHAGVFAPWSPSPAVDTAVRLILCPPYDLAPIALEALVVFAMPDGVGLQLTGLDAERRQVIEGYAATCRARRQADVQRQVEAIHASVPERQPRAEEASPPASPARAAASGSPGLEPPSALQAPAPQAPTVQAPALQAPALQAPAVQAPPSAPQPARAPWEGSLSQLSVAQVLTTLAQRNASGRLVLQAGESSAELYFQNGAVTRILEQPARPDHLLGEMLVKAGQLRHLDRQSALAQSREQGVPLGQSLVKRGILSVPALGQSLAKQSQARLYGLSHWTAGSFSFIEGLRPTQGPPLPPAHPVRVLFRGKVDEYRNRLPQEIEAAESGFTELYVFRAEGAPDDMSALGLNDQELRFWEQAVTGGYYLKEIYPLSNLSRRHSHALMFALFELGMLAFKKEMAPVMRARKMREALKLKASRMERDSLFNMLELHWMADDQDIELGYRKVCESYDCTSLGELLPTDVHEMSRNILKRAAEARDALRTHEQRRKYRHSILEPNQIRFSADLLDQQGDMSWYRGDWREAEHRFSHILEIEPGNKEAAYKLEQVRARKMASGPPTSRGSSQPQGQGSR